MVSFPENWHKISEEDRQFLVELFEEVQLAGGNVLDRADIEKAFDILGEEL